jgi:hypothetical protein
VAGLTELRLRYRSGFAFVDGVLADGDIVNLCRLWYAAWWKSPKSPVRAR